MRHQHSFDFPQARPSRGDEPIIIDYFAGGGGASTGIERALGRSPNYAVNHDAVALAMHAANHPNTKHLCTSVWAVDPRDLVQKGQHVGLMWFSPDCKHHSKAKGGKPLEKHIRDLAWVVVSCAEKVQPDIIMLENVEEFKDWCPLTSDNKPDLERRGETFSEWVKALRKLGYKVEWRELRACDYGAPTIRKRLFVIARRDGRPIVWPEPTHGSRDSDLVQSGHLLPWRSAADIIDWSQPCPSIFDTREEIWEKYGLRAIRPLADNTLKRVAAGIQRYVLDASEPFFVSYGQHGGRSRSAADPMHTITASNKDQNAVVTPTLVNVANSKTTGRGPNTWDIREPVRTLTTSPGFAVVAPTMVQTGYGERKGQAPRALDLQKPLGTVVAGGGKHALVSAFLAQHNTQRQGVHPGRAATDPLATLTTRATQVNVVAANMISLRGTQPSNLIGRSIEDPLATISAGGTHAGLIAAFMTKYYGTAKGAGMSDPMHTLTTKDRFTLVTCDIAGEPYYIADIGMRMLTAREMFSAQGFGPDYIIDRDRDGKAFTKTDQTRMCGNSVPPDLAETLVRANAPHLAAERVAA